MNRYAHKIVIALGRKGIKGTYNPAKEVVHACYQTQYGEMFGIYQYADGVITSSVIYSQAVPQGKEKQVSEYLSNTKDFTSYVDNSISYVALDSNYHIEKEESIRFEEFCIRPYNTLMKNQQAVFDIITKSESSI